MLRLLTPLALLAGAALALPAAAEGRCVRGGTVVTASDEGRVVFKRSGRLRSYYGCLPGQRRRPRLLLRSRARVITLARVNAPYAAFVVRDRASGRAVVRVLDLESRRTVVRSSATKGEGPARDWAVTDLVVTGDGLAAWITRYRHDSSVNEVRAFTSTGDRLFDRDAVDPRSLTLRRTTVRWNVKRVSRSVRLV